MLCLLVYYWQDGEKGHEYTWLNEMTEATFPGFRAHRHVGSQLVGYWCPFWDIGRDPLSLHELCKLHVPGSLCLRNFQWGIHVHLELYFLSCSPRFTCPAYLGALESCWKSCEISTVISARADISAVMLYLARSHESCSDIFLLARERWPFLRVKCPALELLFLELALFHESPVFLARTLCFK